MREIPLTGAAVALIDDDDAERVLAFGRWHLHILHRNSHGVAYRYAEAYAGGRTTTMHRFLMCPPSGMVVDHANHDGLDNRRANLRICTPSQNLANRRKQRGASSLFLGVYWHKYGRKWAAEVDGRHLGMFTDEVEAAKRYDAAARELYGEFASLNFPTETAA